MPDRIVSPAAQRRCLVPSSRVGPVLAGLLVAACAGAPASRPAATEPAPRASSAAEPEPDPGGVVIGEGSCETDAECVPATCCPGRFCAAERVARATVSARRCITVECPPADPGVSCFCHEGTCASRSVAR
jgi:hypothetical protein